MSRKIDPYPIPSVCEYCGNDVIYTSNSVVYGREYGAGRIYLCEKCWSYVGVHPGTNIPLGRLANKELRELKKKCHELFDLAWQGSKRITRDKAYERLAFLLQIPKEKCHFGWFGKEKLSQALMILQNPNWYKNVDVHKRSRKHA